jgi:hypothetical protein
VEEETPKKPRSHAEVDADVSKLAGVAPRSPLGMNLRFVSYSSSSPAFTNVLRMGMPWISRTTERWDDGRRLARSPKGWIEKLEPGQIAATLVPSGVGGRMVLLWEGDGRVSVENPVRIIESRSNRVLFEAPSHTQLLIHMSQIDPKNPPKNIALVPAELEKTHQQHVFHPLFLERLAPFKVIRFLEWSHINGSKLEKWADRTPPDAVFQSTEAGVAYEYQIDLVNQLGADIWLCIPHQANDEFVTKLAELVATRLHPKGRVWVEWSNEVWNDGPAFPQGQYARVKGLEARLHASDGNVARLRYQAKRSVEIFRIFGKAISEEHRLVRVIANQTGNTWAHQELLEYQDTHKVTDALAIAPYFGGELGDTHREAWLVQSSVDEILDELEKKILVEAIGLLTDSAKIAKKYGVDLVAYEGGQHLVAHPGIHNNPVVNDKLDGANRHPRMKEMTLELLNAWKRAGGKTFVYYAFDGAPNKWGRFGALEYIDQPIEQANKYDALIQFVEQNPRWW